MLSLPFNSWVIMGKLLTFLSCTLDIIIPLSSDYCKDCIKYVKYLMPDIYSAFNIRLLGIRVVIIVVENSAYHLKVNLANCE